MDTQVSSIHLPHPLRLTDIPVVKRDQFGGRPANYIDYEDLMLDIARLPSFGPPKVPESAWDT